MSNKKIDQSLSLVEIASKSNALWEKLADWWDNEIKEGDPFHKQLIFPHMIKLSEISTHKKVLDIGCGNGALSRCLSDLGADVLACDVSETFIKKAQERTEKNKIKFMKIDATSKTDLQKLINEEKFDLIVSSMVLHDLPTIEPLVQCLPLLLKKDAHFLFSIPHPCFNSGSMELDFFSEEPSIKRRYYIKEQSLLAKAKDNQPTAHFSFHRSFTDIFSILFKYNLVLDQFVEPTLIDIVNASIDEKLAWKHLAEIPPVAICRFRI